MFENCAKVCCNEEQESAIAAIAQNVAKIGESGGEEFPAMMDGIKDLLTTKMLGEDVGIWYHATVRGDRAPIIIGDRSNIQDNAVVHVDAEHGVKIGKNVTIGHSAVIHGCEIGDNSLILGNPAKVKRAVTEEEIASSLRNAECYVEECRVMRSEEQICQKEQTKS